MLPAAVGLVLGGAVLSSGLSEIVIAGGAPQAALGMLGARSKAVAAILASQDASLGLADADRIALQGLSWSTLNVPAIRTLGLRAGEAGDLDRALRLMRLAGRNGWRDVPTQAWLMSAASAGENYPVTVQRASALIRLGVAKHDLFVTLRALAGDAKALPALIDELAEGPGWRLDFFQSFADTPPALEGNVERIALALHDSPTPPTRAEMLAFLRLLVQRGETARGWALWQRLFGGEQKPGIWEMPWLPIDAGEPPTPFDWTPASDDKQFDYERVADTQMLVIVGTKTGPAIQRWLALAPGSYRLGGGLVTGNGHWTLACGDRMIPFSEGVVTVPAGCTVQRLIFEIDNTEGATRVSAPSLSRS